MPVSGNYGTPTNPYGDIFSSYWELQWYSGSDPAHTQGDRWGRSDLTPGNSIGTIRVDHYQGSGLWDVPVYPSGSSTSAVEEVRRVQTPNGEGYIPVVNDSGNYNGQFPQITFQHGGNGYSWHDDPVAIPNSGVARWTFDDADTSGSTSVDVWGENDGTISGASTGVTGIAGYDSGEAYSFDGTDNYVDLGFEQTNKTVTLWFQTSHDFSDYGSLFDHAGARLGQIRFGSDNHVHAYASDDSFQSVSSDSTLNDGDSHFCALLVEFGNELGLKIDDESPTTTPLGSEGDQSQPMQIGRAISGGSPTNYVTAVVDDPRIYDTRLSNTELENLRTTGSVSG